MICTTSGYHVSIYDPVTASIIFYEFELSMLVVPNTKNQNYRQLFETTHKHNGQDPIKFLEIRIATTLLKIGKFGIIQVHTRFSK